MMALSKKMLEQEPSEIELLLPWHAAGTLNARDARRVEEALARDPALAKQYAAIRGEYEETIHLNESLGAPSARAMQKLFAAIDAEPARAGRFAAAVGAHRDLLREPVAAYAGLVGEPGRHRAAAAGRRHRRRADEDPARDLPDRFALGRARRSRVSLELHAARALVRFTPEARVADITALLDSYQASIIGDAKGGMFRLQFDKAMSRDELASLLGRMQREKFVNLAVAAP